MKTLENLREEINAIDAELKKLLDRRFSLSGEVGKTKAALNIQVFDGKREQAILEGVKNDKSLVHNNEIMNVYAQIMKESRGIQEKIITAGR